MSFGAPLQGTGLEFDGFETDRDRTEDEYGEKVIQLYVGLDAVLQRATGGEFRALVLATPTVELESWALVIHDLVSALGAVASVFLYMWYGVESSFLGHYGRVSGSVLVPTGRHHLEYG